MEAINSRFERWTEAPAFWGLPWLLILISLFSVILRLIVVSILGNEVLVLPGIADQLSYHTLSVRVLEGHGFSFGEPWWPATRANEPTAHWSYLYTSYLFGVYRLFGIKPLIARLIQALVVGFFQPIIAFLITRRVFNRRAGYLAAVLTAGYAYFVYYAATLMTEAYFILAMMISVLLAIRLTDENRSDGSGARTRSGWLAILLGVSMGVMVLLRQVALLIVPVILLWILLRNWQVKRLTVSVRQVGAAAIVLIAMILPWTAFNYSRFQKPVLLNTNAGFAFYLSNHPIYGTDFQPILSEDTATYGELIPANLAGLSEPELDQELMVRGLRFVSEDPIRYIELSISRIPDFFMFWPAADSSRISNLSRTLSFGLLWPFILAGLVLAGLQKSGVGSALKSGEGLITAIILAYSAVHILSWALVRYRIPLDALMITFAAFSFERLWDRIRKSSKSLVKEQAPNPNSVGG